MICCNKCWLALSPAVGERQRTLSPRSEAAVWSNNKPDTLETLLRHVCDVMDNAFVQCVCQSGADCGENGHTSMMDILMRDVLQRNLVALKPWPRTTSGASTEHLRRPPWVQRATQGPCVHRAVSSSVDDVTPRCLVRQRSHGVVEVAPGG